MEFPIFKILIPTTLAFCLGILLTPILTHYLFAYRVWKKQGGKTAIGGHVATEFNRLKGGDEIKTPRMGGIVIWMSVILTLVVFYLGTIIWPDSVFTDLFFLSRAQTWIPLSTLLVGAGVGFLNDY